ncbi:flagellar motor switch protein FliN [Vibrio sp. V27_P1S3P104]|uniref:flagellar motor switch protein FliN n=1 Tax=unclassified Vibrio TaxID=2614977 RepID=UPI0013723376|nr:MULTISPECIES: flagellar motor switch protein FliN [unclassified Vibrio]NAW70623.1 flagellar motor switch protein FliN [Vibrio sp. V28_P6S34P95]NAX05108.1 flagellar motor switch protein FliN [Vibrio sp. V30_P3S12P165]NAX35565.1 flagellar motor switch protein FliN [Vibrio sp. V29_P1S30P107]NAX36864.1 flagellar motor switch protein FliN [Vibrio sp. V27_P1S3P104]NAX40082.1 flagellar motor switch protein FliN [Vibrio sp. V26_P1S5P106]
MSESFDNTTFDTDDINFDNFQLEDLDAEVSTTAATVTERDLSFFKHIPVTVTLEVASKEIALGDLMKAGEGTVLELDKLNGEPLDVKVNGALMGHAEVVVINDKYGLRLIDVLDSALAGVGQ